MIESGSFVPEEVTDNARPPPAAADLMLYPVTAEAVDASTLNDGLVVPLGPTVNARAELDVIVVGEFKPIEAFPLATIVKASFVADEIAAIETPLPAALPVM